MCLLKREKEVRNAGPITQILTRASGFVIRLRSVRRQLPMTYKFVCTGFRRSGCRAEGRVRSRARLVVRKAPDMNQFVSGTSAVPTTSALLSKVPAVTLMFWIIKIVATTLGETGGDAVSMTLDLGYAVASVIFIAIFVVAVGVQLAAKSFRPFLYWFVIVATTTAGTTMADYATRSLGIGYTGGSTMLFALLMVSLGIWYWAAGSVSVESIVSRKIESFYWITILFSQTLGTALGDWVADTNNFGYEGGAIVFGAGLVAIAAAYFFTNISRTFLFWSAFILTRPLGATLGDLLDKPVNHGGLALDRFAASGALAVFIIVCIALTGRRSEAPDGTPA